MLPQLELANGIEELYAATVMEMNRGGPWVVPTLYGRPRIAKPPLPAWCGGLAVSADTMAGVASPDPAARAAAFARLAWQVRWPALLAGCLLLVATYDLGRSVGGRRVGLAAAIVAATSFLFLRYARLGTADVYLGLFVAAANAAAARALLRRQRWRGVVGTGAALGLAFMCKGPVCLVQTLLPLAAWAGAVAWSRRPAQPAGREPADRRAGFFAPALVAFAVFLLVALPWPIVVLRSLNGAWNLWRREVTREGATDHEYGPVWSYLSLLPNLLPWLPMFLLGVGLVFRRGWAPSRSGTSRWRGALRGATAHRGYLLALLLLLVPLVVMSLVRDKSERYLMPVLPAAAVLAGRGMVAVLAAARSKRAARPVAVAVLSLQLGLVAALLLALPIVGLGRFAVARADGRPWFGWPLGLAALAGGAAVVATMFAVARRGRPALAVGLAAAGLLAANALLIWGYKDDPAGRAEMRPIADRILARHPDPVVVYSDPQKPLPPDLPIYLNRVVRNVRPAVAARATTRPAGTPAAAGEPASPGWPDGRTPDVVVMLQRENAPPPALPGWRPFAKEPYKKRFWHALERDPAVP